MFNVRVNYKCLGYNNKFRPWPFTQHTICMTSRCTFYSGNSIVGGLFGVELSVSLVRDVVNVV